MTGSGTTFTADMVGRYFRTTDDGNWYKIASYTSGTVITLEREFGGTTATGEAYTIGQMPILPDGYHMAPVHYAVGHYWLLNDASKATSYLSLFERKKEDLKREHGSKYNSPVVNDGTVDTVKNPNLYVEL